MHRLFVALRPPLAMRTRLLAVMGGVENARCQCDDQLHLTLRFIGEVDRPQANDVAAALATVTHPVPKIALAGTGSFDRKRWAHTLWAGVAPDAALTLLQQRVNRALVRAAIMPEERAFKPHITLARLARDAAQVAPFLHDTAGLAGEAVRIGAFILFESRLGHYGASYDAIARYPLN